MLFILFARCDLQSHVDFDIENENLETTRKYIEHGGKHAEKVVHIEEKCDDKHHGDCHSPVTETITTHKVVKKAPKDKSSTEKASKDKDSSEKVIELFNDGHKVGHRVRREYNVPHNMEITHPVERIRYIHHPEHHPLPHRHARRLINRRLYYNNPNNVNYGLRMNFAPLNIRYRHRDRHHNIHGYGVHDEDDHMLEMDHHDGYYRGRHGIMHEHDDPMIHRDICEHEPIAVYGHNNHDEIEIEHRPRRRFIHEDLHGYGYGHRGHHLGYSRDSCRFSHNRRHRILRMHNTYKTLEPYYYEDDPDFNEDSNDIRSLSPSYRIDRADKFIMPE